MTKLAVDKSFGTCYTVLSWLAVGQSSPLFDNRNEVGTMETKTGSSKVETAYGKPQPKDKQDYTFEYRVFANAEEAVNAGFNFVDLANAAEKSNKKSAAYQNAIAWAKPDPNTPEATIERLVKDYMKLGIPEELARNQVKTMLANAKK